ncbi:phosphatase PAP2 family protein [Dysosmobacter sp.]|uniref:phosphatase PAP2 family protein n=1 Tax=Dysosmobacter sp. TaxID=2591382 RepID=UPI003A8EDEE9
MKVLYALESIRVPWLDTVMAAITHLGEETVFMVAALFVFWCVSKRHGYYLLAIGFAGTVLNQFLKLLFRIPRPWVLDSNFTIVESARAQATGYSFPSGHSQNAIGTFGGIARFTRRKWVRVAAIVVAVLVPLSRMYLGVHTPLDVGVAAVIAVALVFALYPLMERSDSRHGVMGAVLAVMLALAVGYLLFVSLYPFPADVDAANLASGVENAWKLLGATVGMLVGWWLDVRFIHFDTRAVWYVQLIKLVGGLALLLGIRAALKAPLAAALGAGAGGAVRYGVMVLFAAAVWPMVFAPLCHALKKRVY